jgi:hypothetical protein
MHPDKSIRAEVNSDHGPNLKEALRWRALERQLRAAGWSKREAVREVAREKEREERERRQPADKP